MRFVRGRWLLVEGKILQARKPSLASKCDPFPVETVQDLSCNCRTGTTECCCDVVVADFDRRKKRLMKQSVAWRNWPLETRTLCLSE